MSNPTKEQQNAIDIEGKNVIVSAGAGSGKTFVLKERVLRLVTNKTSVDKLVILTFTNNAAAEMKDRIRKIISESKDPKVIEQAPLVDSAYITTFDSYAQSLVKKYNYLLGIDKNFSIIDQNIVDTEINKIIDEILEEYYLKKEEDFNELINNYCYKDDSILKTCIIKMYHHLANYINKTEFLEDYIGEYFNDIKIEEFKTEYIDMIFEKIEELKPLYEELLEYTLKDTAIVKNTQHINEVTNASTYEELQIAFSTNLANAYKGWYEEGYKPIKDKISKIEEKIASYLKYDMKEYIEQYISTKVSVSVIIKILKELDEKITNFKIEHNSYEFNDIAIKAIELVKNYEQVRNEIKNNTYEIMIDEYQDTNDIQEKFISYIENNNVYMVGDVKQSIYRFRNANPYIFKSKYDAYNEISNTDSIGYRIDLTSNFRSRNEVIKNINDLFSIIMTDNVGGANYKKQHCMEHGNTKYDKLIEEKNYNMEILSYKNPKETPFSQVEIESFIMADDILKRIQNKEKAVHEVNNEMILEDISFKDFCVLIDKSKNFETVKKIFEYKGIPTTIYKDISIKEDDEIYILKNLITLLIKTKEEKIDIDFKHAFMSISRSYINKTTDQEIYEIFNNNSYKDTTLYKKIKELSLKIDSLSNKEILLMLIDEFEILTDLITVGNIKERNTKLEYFINTSDSLNKFGMDIYSMNSYFDTVLNSDDDITMSSIASSSDSVKIMTIHKSKGLEFNYVYSPFLNSKFSQNKKDNYYLSNKYGFILPYNDGKYENTFIDILHDYRELKENISEKLRLFYVDITRAKEKFIMLNSFDEENVPIDIITETDILNCNSYSNMLEVLKNKLQKYITNINIDNLNISKKYMETKNYNYRKKLKKTNEIIEITPLRIKYNLLENKHFSKTLNKVIDKDLKKLLEFGTYMHYVFEVYDFKKDNINDIDINNIAKEKIENFLKHDEVKNIKNANIYKEHEIRFEKDDSIYHGFIDLLLEYDDHFDIIDYKLSNIDSEEYKIQLNGYKNYIEYKFKKPTNIYLYSINKDEFKKL